MADTRVFIGQVKTFNPIKGWGHIESDEAKAAFGKDIMIRREHIPNNNVAKGSQVCFCVEHGAKGPEATNIQLIAAAAGWNVGTIKSWNPVKGWGHIECAETFTEYGKDIFVMRSALAGGTAEKGAQVSFSVEQGAKGPEATNVQFTNPTANKKPASGWNVGTIKSWNPVKGWGHIECQETFNQYGKDIFVMRSALVGAYSAEKGAQVSFSVEEGTKGPEAANVQFTSPVAANNQQQNVKSGKVKMFNTTSGWGFVQCNQLGWEAEWDVYITRRELNGYEPQQGDDLSFDVVYDQTGRPEAKNIKLMKRNNFRAAPY